MLLYFKQHLKLELYLNKELPLNMELSFLIFILLFLLL